MNLKVFIQRHPVLCYFIITFFISWVGAFMVVAPKLISHQPVPKIDGILMFPVMILGPAAAGIVLTFIKEGRQGLQNLWSRMTKWKVTGKWYLIALLVIPCLILTVLLLLKNFVDPAFTPNFFPFGLLFGIPAGFIEEIGWSGFAFPQMRLKGNIMKTGLILGVLWGIWHLPVIDFLGAASPHGSYCLPFALAFIAAMSAVRFIIIWVYENTNSILLAQLVHIISTGSLVFLGPSNVTPGQEALWYGSYAIILWITVLIIFSSKKINGKPSSIKH